MVLFSETKMMCVTLYVNVVVVDCLIYIYGLMKCQGTLLILCSTLEAQLQHVGLHRCTNAQISVHEFPLTTMKVILCLGQKFIQLTYLQLLHKLTEIESIGFKETNLINMFTIKTQ